MANPQTKPIAIEASTGNVFADLGLPDAEKLKIKSGWSKSPAPCGGWS